MANKRSVRPWVLEARAVQYRVANLHHGNRELGLQEIAGKNRNAQTLRRQISALDFLNRLNEEAKYTSANKLEAYPVAAIEYLSRWYKRDAKAALQAADKLLSGDYDVKGLGAAEKNSRKDIFKSSGKALETDYRYRIKDKIFDIVRKAAGRDVTPFKSNDLGDPVAVLDFAYENAAGERIAGVLICGPYRDPDMYRRRAFDWVSKANTLLNIFKIVFLVLPDNANSDHFETLIRRLKIDENKVRIEKLYSSQK
jgi:hypothetical protein